MLHDVYCDEDGILEFQRFQLDFGIWVLNRRVDNLVLTYLDFKLI